MTQLVCPTCARIIDPSERCVSERGMGRCMESQGHDGYHWTDLGSGGVTIWTGLHSRRSCPGRLSLRDWCVKPPGHDGGHNNGRGITFGDPEPEEA